MLKTISFYWMAFFDLLAGPKTSTVLLMFIPFILLFGPELFKHASIWTGLLTLWMITYVAHNSKIRPGGLNYFVIFIMSTALHPKIQNLAQVVTNSYDFGNSFLLVVTGMATSFILAKNVATDAPQMRLFQDDFVQMSITGVILIIVTNISWSIMEWIFTRPAEWCYPLAMGASVSIAAITNYKIRFWNDPFSLTRP